MTRRLVAVAAALALAVPGPAMALTVSDVSEDLRCVTCGTPLDVSNAPAAQQMKAQIQRRIDQGWTEQQIKDEFVRDFGRQVLATPPRSGFDLLAWILPAIAVGGGLAAVPFIVRGWTRRRREVVVAAPAELSAEDRERIERELRELGDG